jgi:hypothetical protein
VLTQELVQANRILSLLEGREELRRREKTYRTMNVVHSICHMLLTVAGHDDLEKMMSALKNWQRRLIIDHHEQLSVAAENVLDKIERNHQPYEIMDHAGDKKLLMDTARHALSVTQHLLEPLPPRVDPELLNLLTVQSLRALVSLEPLLDQIRPEAGPKHETVVALRNGLNHLRYNL